MGSYCPKKQKRKIMKTELEKLIEKWESEKGSYIPNAPIYQAFINEAKEALKREKQGQSLPISNVVGSYLPKCTRVEVIDKTGRAYTNYQAKNVETQMQDDDRTLKVFIS